LPSISGWFAYAISVFGISAVITPYGTISFYDQVYKTVRPTLEDIRIIFSQKEHKRVSVSLRAVIEYIKSSLAGKLIAGKIKVHVDLDGDLPDTQADRVQIEQVVLNLLRNSVEAFDGTRSRSRLIELRARKVNGEAVEVSVGDNGRDLTAKLKSRCGK